MAPEQDTVSTKAVTGKDERGASSIEYGLLLTAVALVVAGAALTLSAPLLAVLEQAPTQFP